MLTKTLLQKLANTTSYSRGEDYFYNHHVRRVNRSGNTFTGSVEGSERYDVSLTLGGTPLTKSGANFSCTCPYDFDGICKHCVAFGLAVTDQFGPDIEPVDTASSTDIPAPTFDTLWHQTTTDQKLTFLRQLLEKQPDIRAQFAQFAEPGQTSLQLVFFTKADNDATGETRIDTISSAVFGALSELRFDDDWLETEAEDHYSEELPDPNPLIESVLTEYADQVIKAFREGRLTDAMTVYLGVYEGTQAATESDDDEYGVIGDYPEQTWEVWHDLLTNAHRQLSERVLHPDQITQSLNQLAERVTLFDAKNEEDDNSTDDDEHYNEQGSGQIWYNLKPFEPLLSALVTDRPSAQIVQQAIGQHNWQNRGTEYVQLRIADVLPDPDLWLQTADLFADRDPGIALQLLQRRRQTGDMPVLVQILHRLTKLFPQAFDAFILDTFDDTLLIPGPDLTLYFTALENRCRSAGQLTDYLKLRSYWTESRRRQFADSLASPYGSSGLFYAQLLQTEGRTDDLFAWAKTLSWPFVRSMPDILLIAARTHPNECMDLAMERIGGLLENGQRDRGLYHTIAGWLAALNTVPSLKPQVAIFAGHLIAAYKRLVALKDELRMKGLAR